MRPGTKKDQRPFSTLVVAPYRCLEVLLVILGKVFLIEQRVIFKFDTLHFYPIKTTCI